MPLYYRYMMREKAEEREQTRELYLSNLLELTAAKSKSGPFFMGQHLGLVRVTHTRRSFHFLIGFGSVTAEPIDLCTGMQYP